MNVVDSAGNVQNNYDYDIYGMGKAITENGLKNPVRYAGEYFDEESGLYYLRGRYYNPDTMRFMSEDSYKGEIGSPLSLNLYAYCGGNPIEYSDPSGHFKCSAVGDGSYDDAAPAPVVNTPKPKSTWQSVKETSQMCSEVSSVLTPMVVSSAISNGNKEATAAAVKAGADVIEQKIVEVINVSIKPTVSDVKLGNIIENLYKGQMMKKLIGNGTTMDAVRYELRTGKKVGGVFHSIKAENSINGLTKILKRNINDADRRIAEALIEDLKNALSGK